MSLSSNSIYFGFLQKSTPTKPPDTRRSLSFLMLRLSMKYWEDTEETSAVGMNPPKLLG